MRRSVPTIAIMMLVAGLIAGAGAASAAAAERKLPIQVGPAGMTRQASGPTPRVVGGTPVPNGTYRFQAALLAQSFGSNDYERQFCGGSLITPSQVLTAAHCVEFFGDAADQLPLSELRVVVGRTVLSSTQGQRRRVDSVVIHPRWNPDTFSHDAAVINLVSPVTGIQPVLLVTPGTDTLERPGTLATVTGWGNTIAQPAGPGGGGINHPDRLREAQVPIVSRPECKAAYGADFIDATMLCAGKTNRDTCQGDSGGPLFFRAAGSARYIQAGITSWGIGCGATGFPGVYTRLGNPSVGKVLTATGGVPVTAAA